MMSRKRSLLLACLALACALTAAAEPGKAPARRDGSPPPKSTAGARPAGDGKAATAAKDEPAAPAPKPRPAWEPGEPRVTTPSDPEPIAIVGADIHPVVGPVVPGGTILLAKGRIEAILGASARVPDGYRVIPAHGLQAWPGYVALGADGLGLAGDAWAGGTDATLVRGVGESFDAWADDVELAASAGITSALITRSGFGPGRPVLDGRAAVLKMSARHPDGALMSDLAGVLAGRGLLDPAGTAQFRKAVADARQGRSGEGKGKKPDPKAAIWRALARRDIPLIAPYSQAADVLRITELCADLDLRLILVTPTEAWAVADRLVESGVDLAVAQNVRGSWGKPRADRRALLPGGQRFDAPSILARAGLPVAIVPGTTSIRVWGVAGRDFLDLPIEAAFAVRGGMSETEAIEAITITPARILGLDDRIGSLQRGKDADVILLDGDPLDYRTFVRKTIVGGRIVHELEKSRFWAETARERDRALADRTSVP